MRIYLHLQKVQFCFSLFPFLQKLKIFGNSYYNQEIDYIKRIIAVPGDTLDIKNGKVFINGKQIEESYVKGEKKKKTSDVPIKIDEGMYFVMGDNRPCSRDSRSIGLIEWEKLKGKAVFRYWPFNDVGELK